MEGCYYRYYILLLFILERKSYILALDFDDVTRVEMFDASGIKV